jgi:nucleotide-binding universal stress UspA family protein
MIRTILCPTDLTSDSKDGLTYAFSLAKRNGAQLIVFHATSFPKLYPYPSELDSYYHWQQWVSAFKMDQLLREAERTVRCFVCENFRIESECVEWKPKIALGSVAGEIVTAALQEDADLIVMDRRQRSLLARAVRRGTLEKVGRDAPCPVLSIDATRPIHRSGEWRLPMLEELAHSY